MKRFRLLVILFAFQMSFAPALMSGNADSTTKKIEEERRPDGKRIIRFRKAPAKNLESKINRVRLDDQRVLEGISLSAKTKSKIRDKIKKKKKGRELDLVHFKSFESKLSALGNSVAISDVSAFVVGYSDETDRMGDGGNYLETNHLISVHDLDGRVVQTFSCSSCFPEDLSESGKYLVVKEFDQALLTIIREGSEFIELAGFFVTTRFSGDGRYFVAISAKGEVYFIDFLLPGAPHKTQITQLEADGISRVEIDGASRKITLSYAGHLRKPKVIELK